MGGGRLQNRGKSKRTEAPAAGHRSDSSGIVDQFPTQRSSDSGFVTLRLSRPPGLRRAKISRNFANARYPRIPPAPGRARRSRNRIARGRLLSSGVSSCLRRRKLLPLQWKMAGLREPSGESTFRGCIRRRHCSGQVCAVLPAVRRGGSAVLPVSRFGIPDKIPELCSNCLYKFSGVCRDESTWFFGR